MGTNKKTTEVFDETQSLLVIKEMIQVSKAKFKQDGILFILWGWLLFYNSMQGYVQREMVLTFRMEGIIKYIGFALLILCVGFTAYYLLQQRKKVQTYIGISLRYVWVALFFSMVLVNLIQFNVLHSINFELQHPIFMVLMAFAVTVTGGILRTRLIIAGGVIFAALALVASYLTLEVQLLLESVAWLVAFIIPGHILFANRNK